MTAAALLLVLAMPAIAAAVPFQLAYTLPHPAPSVGDFFGAAVALGSGRLAVGAPRHDLTGAADAGAVYLHDVGTGGLVTTLLAPAPTVDARLGTSVAVDGVVAAGAPHENTGEPHAGAVHRFGLGGGHQGSIPNPAPGFDDVFGCAVAVRGTDLVAGARLDGVGLANAGAAWLLGTGGGVQHTLLAPTPAAYADFGQSVAMGASDVVVGAPSDDTAAANAGAAYVFATGSGALRWTLTRPPPALGDDFGRAVAIGDTLVAVGAPLDESERVAHSGAVYLFDLATGALVRRLTSPNAQPSGRFGAAVAFRGGDVVVGAPFEDHDEVVDVGAVYVFDPVGTPIATIPNPTPNADDQFGIAVATDGGAMLVVGAWHDDQAAQDAGAVHVFVDVGTPTTTTLPGGTTTSTTLSIPSTTVSTTSTSVTTTSATTLVGGSTTTTTTTVDGTSTTSTVSQLPASTSTTVPIACTPGVPFVCDDRDACTIDACEGACVWIAVTGLDGVTCRLDTMGAVMGQAGVVALGGRRAAQKLEKQLGNVRRLVERARRASGKQAATRLRRARRALEKYIVAVERSRSKARMAGTLADGLLTLAGEAAQRLGEVR